MDYRRMNIDIIVHHRPDGKVIPLRFRLEDGTTVNIDKVLHSERAASLKVGGCGIRYAVMIRGIERYIFEDEGVWYVEARTT
jgi:hypothetical protein